MSARIPRSVMTLTTIREAIRMAEPAILGLMSANIAKRPILAVAVRINERPNLDYETWLKLNTEFDEEERFMLIARGKAALSQRTGMSTSLVVAEYPHLLLSEDPKYPGGVHEAGISVGCSAWQAYFDELAAWWITAAIIAHAKNVFATEVATAEPDFVSECLGMTR